MGLSLALEKGKHRTAVGVQEFGAIYYGQAAQRAYLEIISPETSDEMQRSSAGNTKLLRLDTFAMVRLAKFFDET